MKPLACAIAAAVCIAAGPAAARDTLRIVGSSTVYPFAASVADQFARSGAAAPTIEATGTGGGIKLFCAGVGEEHPDIANASRRMKAAEQALCLANGVDEIVEVGVGYDGVVVANAVGATALSLTREQLFRALVAGSEATLWSDVGDALPDTAIEVLGPPPSSGTRDAFEELVMEEGCDIANENGGSFDCHAISMRTDGAWIDSGENDNLIVEKLTANPNQLGVFGYSFLAENSGAVQGASIDGAPPVFDQIASGAYPVSRKLYFYVKVAHVGVIQGVYAYLDEFTYEIASGDDGYLLEKGLIPLPANEHAVMRDGAVMLTSMDALR